VKYSNYFPPSTHTALTLWLYKNRPIPYEAADGQPQYNITID